MLYYFSVGFIVKNSSRFLSESSYICILVLLYTDKGIEMETRKGIDRAIEAVGSQRNLAKMLGITDQAISFWVQKGHVPLPRLKEVSALTGVAVGDLLMDVATTMDIEVVAVPSSD